MQISCKQKAIIPGNIYHEFYIDKALNARKIMPDMINLWRWRPWYADN